MRFRKKMLRRFDLCRWSLVNLLKFLSFVFEVKVLKIFQWMYDKALTRFKHRYAERYFVGMNVTDSVIFPISSDAMLAPMVLAQPAKALRFASVTTAAIVLAIGSLLGWLGWGTVALGGVSYYSYG